jgi:tetratricopeptide (TPR) repeat protein
MNRRVLLLAPLLVACGHYFYQAPPPIEAYPRRIPGKSWSEVFRELKPPPADAADQARQLEECRNLAALLPGMPVVERLAKIDALLTSNREGNFSLQTANVLHEMRDLASDDATLALARPLLEARLMAALPTPMFGKLLDEQKIHWVEQGLGINTPRLVPYRQIQEASVLMKPGKYAEAKAAFLKVMESFPGHPRAEVACFMAARAELEHAREVRRKLKIGPEKRELLQASFRASEDAFNAYLAAYPEGRFVTDSYGWQGAIKVEQGNYGAAVEWQLTRLGARPSREVMRSVLRECDGLFSEMFEDAEEEGSPAFQSPNLPYDLMARHPGAARLFVFQALDPVAREGLPRLYRNLSGDRESIDFLKRRIIRPSGFARIALSKLGSAILRSKEDRRDAFTLLVLGWSSMMEKNPGQALELFDQALALGKSDELLQGRAMALADLGRHDEAALAYKELSDVYPDSFLSRSSTFDRAIALFHAREGGEAFMQMLSLVAYPGEVRDEFRKHEPRDFLHPQHEPLQWMDCIAQFSSLEELAKPLATLAFDDPRATVLRAVVRSRAFAARRFDFAKRFLDPNGSAVPSDEDRYYWRRPSLAMDTVRWDEEIAPLAANYAALEQRNGKDAVLHLEIGRQWKALRGRITLPLEQLFDYSDSENEKLGLLRRGNARFLGIPDERIDEELDSRDELTHALYHFLQVVDSATDPDLVAHASAEANEALFRLAEFSHYRMTRAMETEANQLSAKLVSRLQLDCPDRPETARAVAWNFVMPGLLDCWMPGDTNPSYCADLIQGSLNTPALRMERATGDSGISWPKSFEEDDGSDMAAIRQDLAKCRSAFDALRPTLGADQVGVLANDLDDLASVATAPDITPGLFRKYVAMRRSGGKPPAPEGEWSSLAPWLAFREGSRLVEREWSKRPNWHTPAAWEAYLQQFPAGPKSEPASLRILSLKVRKLCPVPKVKAFHFPDAPILAGYKRISRSKDVDREELARLAAGLDEHETRFPGGRYRADISLLRAAVAADLGDYETAVGNLTDLLFDPAHPDLHADAAMQFADCGLRLVDVNERGGLIAAFRKRPQAISLLKNLAYGDTCLFRVRPILAWLEKKDGE